MFRFVWYTKDLHYLDFCQNILDLIGIIILVLHFIMKYKEPINWCILEWLLIDVTSNTMGAIVECIWYRHCIDTVMFVFILGAAYELKGKRTN